MQAGLFRFSQAIDYCFLVICLPSLERPIIEHVHQNNQLLNVHQFHVHKDLQSPLICSTINLSVILSIASIRLLLGTHLM